VKFKQRCKEWGFQYLAGTKKEGPKTKAMKDNREDKVHPARFERLPYQTSKVVEGILVKREKIYRHIKLDLYGAQGLNTEVTTYSETSRQECSGGAGDVQKGRHG
jgi:hypothetical protein